MWPAAMVIALIALARSASEPADIVAFAGVQWSSDQQRATASIYTMRADGTQRRRLTGRGNWTDTDPAWSPDGRRIAFGRYDYRGWRLFTVGASGRNLHAVTGRLSLAEAPTWSRDGRSLAFAGMPAKLPMTGSIAQQIYRIPASGGSQRKLTSSSAGAGTPAWSPDGKRIAFVAWASRADNPRADIWLMKPSGRDQRKLVRDAADPAWSPDGKRIAFTRDGDIYLIAVGSRAVRRVTRTPRFGDADPSWCDNDRLAFASMHRAADQAKDDMSISFVRADGAGLSTIRDGDPRFWADAPACSP